MIWKLERLYFDDLQQAILVSSVGLLVFLVIAIPMGRTFYVGESRLRRAMIERHRAKLKDASLRRSGATSFKRGNLESVNGSMIFSILPARLKKRLEELLHSAGFFEPYTLYALLFAKGLLAVIACLMALLYILPGLADDVGELNMLFGTIVFGVMFFAPDFFLRLKKARRLKNIEISLPDCLDLLVICAEAGLSLDAALKRVAEEFSETAPQIAEELFLTSVELSFLPERRQALANLGHRTDLACLRSVTATLIQTEKYGTPLAQGLRTLASEFRENRLLRAEEKAARLPAVLTVPMIVFILPSLFIVLAAPAFIQVAATIAD